MQMHNRSYYWVPPIQYNAIHYRYVAICVYIYLFAWLFFAMKSHKKRVQIPTGKQANRLFVCLTDCVRVSTCPCVFAVCVRAAKHTLRTQDIPPGTP